MRGADSPTKSGGKAEEKAAMVAVVIVEGGTERWKVSLSVEARICPARPERVKADIVLVKIVGD